MDGGGGDQKEIMSERKWLNIQSEATHPKIAYSPNGAPPKLILSAIQYLSEAVGTKYSETQTL